MRGVQGHREQQRGGGAVGEVESESVISEAVLNPALRQDVLYMLMTLTHTQRQSWACFVFWQSTTAPCWHTEAHKSTVTMTTVKRKGNTDGGCDITTNSSSDEVLHSVT